MHASLPTVLVLGDYRQTLTVIRSLRRSGYPLVLGSGESRGPASLSRHAKDVWKHPPLDEANRESFFSALKCLLDARPDIRCLFPVGEWQITFFTLHRDALPVSIKPVMPGSEVVKLCLNKVDMFTILEECAVPFSDYRIVSGEDEWESAFEAVGFPCIIKAETEQFRIKGKKALIVNSPQDANQIVCDPPNASTRWIIQRYFSGKRHNVYFFADRGALRATVEVRIDRNTQIDDTGLATEGISVKPSPQLMRHTKQLVSRLNYCGAGCAQYLVNQASNEISFLEINSRLGANYAIAHHCGLDLATWWVTYSLNSAPAIQSQYGVEGKRYYWLTGDIPAFKQAVFKKNIPIKRKLVWPLQMIVSLMRANVHIVWDWRDPYPGLHKLMETMHISLKKRIKGLLSNH